MLPTEQSCCIAGASSTKEMNETPIHQVVRERYAKVAGSTSPTDGHARRVAEAFGYTADQLATIPVEANMGLSCGNPTAFANLKLGEVVIDLGCGGGLDVFLAAARVGPSGRAIGIDMTPEMVARARSNAANGAGSGPLQNVEFHLARIEQLPLADALADCIISNCVINLSPNKQAVFLEAARVLKPGGRLAVSDIVLRKPLPKEIANDVAAYTGCIAGAITVDDYRRGLLDAGFHDVLVSDTGADLNAYRGNSSSSCCDSGSSCGCSDPNGTLLNEFDVNEFAASVRVYAVKGG